MREEGFEQNGRTAAGTEAVSATRDSGGQREQAVSGGRTDEGKGGGSNAVSCDISPAFLLDTSSKRPVAAEFWDGITQKQIDDVTNLWMPAKDQHKSKLKATGVPRLQWPQDLHWEWDKKVAVFSGKLAMRGFSVMAEGVTQGLMYAKTVGAAKTISEQGKPLVYIDYVEVAPWNRKDFVYAEPKYSGVGSMFLKAAITLSLEEGFKGRIGLHSLPQSRNFYVKCGMTDFGADAQKQDLHYFEITPAQAQLFLQKA